MNTRVAAVRGSLLGLVVLTLSLALETAALGATAISSVPFKITTAGSYVLSKDLSMTAADQNAITVEANDVTLDLMGFSLSGPGKGAGCGIFMRARENVEVRNGTVANFGGHGIFEAKYWTEESPTSGYGHRVISVRALYNGGAGIDLEGYNHLVRDCTALQNGVDGIYVGPSSMATGNVSNANANDGIGLGNGCLAYNNVASANTWYGIWSWNGCTVLNNTCSYDQYGIYVEGMGALISGNTIRESTADGIYVKGEQNVLEGNLVTGCVNGIYFETSGNFYIGNRASKNTANFTGPGKPTGSPGDGGGNVGF
jgi:parallel beta-helix repeat protein